MEWSAWAGSALGSESTFHQLSPYIGKLKSTIAAPLVAHYTAPGDLVCDPFSGCGTFALEAWVAGRRIIANDISPYATLLTRAKLFPYTDIETARRDFGKLQAEVGSEIAVAQPDLRKVPPWVRSFFHPQTLREVLVWSDVLQRRRKWFLLACLMGILHHQRPGFLSYPSSHSVPYLRIKRFPKAKFPTLYSYRSVADRLEAKMERAFRRAPELDHTIKRKCLRQSADRLRFTTPLDAILTSPPYMRQLDYGRDNRLRLWFLGCADADELDSKVSPKEAEFLALMRRCFRRWHSLLRPAGLCVLVIGDSCSRERHGNLPDNVARIATRSGGFEVISTYVDEIPNVRRVRRGIAGNTSETIIVLQRN